MKALRKKRNWSQEQLAEKSGLSVRTIQRIESTNKAGFASLRALAAVFDVDVVSLQGELAMEKSSTDWKQRPAWVRSLFLGSSKIDLSRRQHRYAEIFAAAGGCLFAIGGGLSIYETVLPAAKAVGLFGFSAGLFLAAYLMALIVRVGDEFAVWPWVSEDIEYEGD